MTASMPIDLQVKAVTVRYPNGQEALCDATFTLSRDIIPTFPFWFVCLIHPRWILFPQPHFLKGIKAFMRPLISFS